MPSVPLVMALPPGVGAVDFYIDLAIDCVETVNVTKPCQVISAMLCQSSEAREYLQAAKNLRGAPESL